VNIVGREALSERDNKYLDFADRFEQEFIQQGYETDRTIDETLDIGWELLSTLPEAELNRVDEEYIEEYYVEEETETVAADD
jgi:V/A-type H+-transporting ATPase subunit B